MAKKNSCYGCEKRYPGCHDKCDTYKKYKEELKKKKEYLKEEGSAQWDASTRYKLTGHRGIVRETKVYW